MSTFAGPRGAMDNHLFRNPALAAAQTANGLSAAGEVATHRHAESSEMLASLPHGSAPGCSGNDDFEATRCSQSLDDPHTAVSTAGAAPAARGLPLRRDG